MLIKKV